MNPNMLSYSQIEYYISILKSFTLIKMNSCLIFIKTIKKVQNNFCSLFISIGITLRVS